jgi:hypothetical protein
MHFISILSDSFQQLPSSTNNHSLDYGSIINAACQCVDIIQTDAGTLHIQVSSEQRVRQAEP